MMSLSQQKKIDELESQLQEAEDIVKDLREELSEAQTQLEKATKNQPQPLAGESLDSETAAPGLMISQLSSQIDAVATCEMNSISNGTYEGNRCYSTNDALKLDGSHIQAPAFKSFQNKRKRAARYRRSKAPSCRYLPHQFKEMHQDLSCTITSALLQSITRNLKSEDEIRKVTESVLTPKLLSDTTEMSTRSGFSNVTDNDAGFVRPCSVQKAMDNDKMIIEESELTRQGSLSAEKLEILACKTDVEKDNRPLNKSDMRASDLDGGTASQPADSKFLKYTFCRNRKKETLSSPESWMRTVECYLLIPYAFSLAQLISLSEKKWWK
ncbi:hypothetical protein L3X38_029307 [Prunus dulcis]|uniref:Uncharacterized protein n=1 Tax=Prunus dulcis TaxID=3755 RepID=A0AAD4VRC8_PRUDU|nr:hypothetical protein L3X38_029307 [Prunus dulcis]